MQAESAPVCRRFGVGEAVAPGMVPEPTSGRIYRATRSVRLGDVRPSGRLRLDALSRYLQDVANDDARDADLPNAMGWVVRRVAMELGPRLPSFREDVELATFCGGTGSRWAERRTDISVDGDVLVRVAALWVHVDPVSGRPAKLPPEFLELYGEAAGGRVVTSRLQHEPPAAAEASDAAEAVSGVRPCRRWPLRVTDFDLLGHVNNAIALAALEDSLVRDEGVPARVEVEYRDAIEPDDQVDLVREPGRMWLVVDGRVRVSAVAAR